MIVWIDVVFVWIGGVGIGNVSVTIVMVGVAMWCHNHFLLHTTCMQHAACTSPLPDCVPVPSAASQSKS